MFTNRAHLPQVTKEELVARWAGEQPLRLGLGESDATKELNPTAQLLQARRKSGEHDGPSTKIKKEMITYEALKELEPNGDRCQYWKEHEHVLPLLARAAREILGIPCSSAKSERTFSTGGQVPFTSCTINHGFKRF